MTTIPKGFRIQHATEAMDSTAPIAQSDKSRPQFHFLPPSELMMDVWSGNYYNDWYHLFYLYNPYGINDENPYVTEKGKVWACFAHARTKDLIHWEHLPLALFPDTDEGEMRGNDGIVASSHVDKPVLIYTSVPFDQEKYPRVQRAAIGDDELITWQKVPGEPMLTLDNHGGPRFKSYWTDPFIFREQGRTFLMFSKCILEDGTETMPVYEALDSSLLKWKFRGSIFNRTGECVKFFKLDGKWVLIYNPYTDPQYDVGDFDLETFTFTSEVHGTLTYGKEYDHGALYSTAVYSDEPNGDIILSGTVSGFKHTKHWNCCMSIPRKLSLNSKNEIVMTPIDAFDSLCSEPKTYQGTLQKGQNTIIKNSSALLDVTIGLNCKSNHKFIIKLLDSNNGNILHQFNLDNERLFNSINVPIDSTIERKIRMIIDVSFAEIFIDDYSKSLVQCFISKGNDIDLYLESESDQECNYTISVKKVTNIWR